MPIKSKSKHRGATKPLRELLPSAATDEQKFLGDMLDSCKEVS